MAARSGRPRCSSSGELTSAPASTSSASSYLGASTSSGSIRRTGTSSATATTLQTSARRTPTSTSCSAWSAASSTVRTRLRREGDWPCWSATCAAGGRYYPLIRDVSQHGAAPGRAALHHREGAAPLCVGREVIPARRLSHPARELPRLQAASVSRRAEPEAALHLCECNAAALRAGSSTSCGGSGVPGYSHASLPPSGRGSRAHSAPRAALGRAAGP